jgi:hypothetical protein
MFKKKVPSRKFKSYVITGEDRLDLVAAEETS